MKLFSSVVGLLASVTCVFGALEQVSDFGENPSTIQMFIYVPSKLATNPPVIVAVSIPFLPQRVSALGFRGS